METRTEIRYWPETHEIRSTVEREIDLAGGVVVDVYDDGARLFLRAVLPRGADVLPGDPLHAGVAVRTAGPELLVHPYTFREVCENGAIRAHALTTHRVERVRAEVVAPSPFDVVLAIDELRRAVRACAAPEVFAAGAAEMRSAAEVRADDVLELMPMLARFNDRATRIVPREFVERIVRRFDAEPDPDRSLYGLVNAVTSVARDTRDPEVRWRLEELGGAMPAWLPTRPRVTPVAAPLARA